MFFCPNPETLRLLFADASTTHSARAVPDIAAICVDDSALARARHLVGTSSVCSAPRAFLKMQKSSGTLRLAAILDSPLLDRDSTCN